MSAPRWARALLVRLADPGRSEEVVGDLEEAHRRRAGRHGRVRAQVLTGLEALDMAAALLRLRLRRRGSWRRGGAVRPGQARGRRFHLISVLDVKLGVRMLVKYPVLSVVSVVGMTVAVAIGASVFGVIRGMTASPLPLHEGERVVAIQNVGPFGLSRAGGTHLHALARWREGVSALEDVGAYRIVTRNVATPDGGVAPARIAEMTASGFRIARVPPLLGRPLIEADEAEGPPVVVIGPGVWQDRFGGRPDVLGRTIRLGATPHMVVGVMPRGFAFPVNDRLWTPLRLDAADYPIGEAPPVQVFARLAPGADLEDAAAQLAVLGERAAAESPHTHAELRPRIGPYTEGPGAGPLAWFLYLLQLFVTGLLVVMAINVAALVYARTVTRSGEIAVRTALGAGRGRIAAQLFAESLLLSAVAAALGLVVAGRVMERVEVYVHTVRAGGAPFWWDFGVTPATVFYAAGLAVLAAVIVGVFPALGATGRRLRAGLQAAGAGSSPPLGRTWTAWIVAQVALAVAILPVALSGAGKWALLNAPTISHYPLDEVLIAELALDEQPAGARAPVSDADAVAAGARASDADPAERYVRARTALERRLEAAGDVALVAVMETAPWEDPDLHFELERGARAAPLPGTPAGMESASSGHRIGRSVVSPEFFAAFEIPVVSGRGLVEGDASSPDAPVVVNRAFVDLVIGGGNPLGRRFRFLTPWDDRDDAVMENRWHTVVGVVPNFPPPTMSKPEATAYQAMAPGETAPVSLAIRVRGGEAERLAGRLRQIGAEVDPALRLERMESLATVMARERSMSRLTILTVVWLAAAGLLLAVAGLYALMSFTVARRQREIGIRMALGARPHGVLRGVLARAARQLAVGVAIGLGLALVLDRLAGGEILGGKEALLLPAVAGLMAAVGILAAWAPARRGLRIQPTDALKAE